MSFSITITAASYEELRHQLGQLLGGGPHHSQAEAPPKGASVNTATAAPAAAAEPAATSKYTVDDIRKAIGPHMEGDTGKALKAVIKEFGCKALADIPVARLDEYMARAEKIIAAATKTEE